MKQPSQFLLELSGFDESHVARIPSFNGFLRADQLDVVRALWSFDNGCAHSCVRHGLTRNRRRPSCLLR